MHRSAFVRFVALLSLGWLPFSASAADPATPGLVREKPAQGRFVQVEQGFMVPYQVTLPNSEVRFEMQPVPGGKFRLGSPTGEAGRSADEGPQIEVEVTPFWIASREATWAEYKQFMALHDLFKRMAAEKLRPTKPDQEALIITVPSKLYDPGFTFELGEDLQQPAATMSQYAAKQYTKWLSGVTGDVYRLPSEAEWEYACRAGTTTAYSFGDDPKQLSDYAWFMANSKDATHPVGQKKPNPWGLYDMHGNVGEWVLDQYSADAYNRQQGKTVLARDTIAWPTKLFPRVVRGGSWDDDPERLRSAARRESNDAEWRAEDPNLPKSPWWFTSFPSLGVGFRVIRPLAVPSLDERKKFWDADIESIQEDANRRIDKDGRGARGIADRELPDWVKKLETK